LTAVKLEWLEEPFEHIPNTLPDLQRHPAACEEFSRRFFALEHKIHLK